MKYIKNTTDFQISEATAVSLGKFDGLHRGHSRLMECLKKNPGLKTVAFTFDIPPRQGLGKQEESSKVLITNEEKRQLFEHKGIDYLLECPFTPEIMHMEPEDFVEMVVKRLHVKRFVVGTDFRFGHGRRGDYTLLLKLAGRYGYEVEVVDKVKENGRDISSTYIREEILAGRIRSANRLLGYPYFVQGQIVHGKELGRQFGLPTANLLPAKEKLLPLYGVYVTRTSFLEQPRVYFGGITNVGCKPTITGERPAGVETHLFDFSGWIYGRLVKVEFLERIREEKKFASLEELKKQMYKDKKDGIKYYANITELC